jgi:hypothetical protein
MTLGLASPARANPLPTVRVGLQAAARDGGSRALPIRLGVALELRWTFGRPGRLRRLRDRVRPDLPLPPTPEIEALVEDGWLDPAPLETNP